MQFFHIKSKLSFVKFISNFTEYFILGFQTIMCPKSKNTHQKSIWNVDLIAFNKS